MISIQKIKLVFILLTILLAGSLACSENSDNKGPTDVGDTDLNDSDTDDRDDTSTSTPTAEDCEGQVEVVGCTALGCTYKTGYAGVAAASETCVYDSEGAQGFCFLPNSNAVSALVTTYVREIDSTNDEAMMLPQLYDDGIAGGWIACSEAEAMGRPGCTCDYAAADD